MAELMWECLLISIILLFGINIGLAMGLTQIPKNKILYISILYGAILFTLSVIASYLALLYNVVNEYIALVIGIIGVIIILSGIYTIIKWRNDKKEYYFSLSKAMLSASVCCFVGFIFTVILLSKNMESFYLELNLILVLTLILIIIAFYSFSKFLRHAKSPYPVLLGNFMILNGFYFLIAAFFIPSIKSLASAQTNPLSIGSTTNMIFLIMAAGGVLLMGVYLKKEGMTI